MIFLKYKVPTKLIEKKSARAKSPMPANVGVRYLESHTILAVTIIFPMIPPQISLNKCTKQHLSLVCQGEYINI